MHADSLLALYAQCHDLEPITLGWFRCALARWNKHLGRPPVVADFTDLAFNAWLTAELNSGELSRQSIAGYRKGVLVIWRWAWREGHIESAPRNPKPVKAPLPVPVGVQRDDAELLLREASKLNGRFRVSKVLKSAFYRALIILVWDTGLRLGDLMRMTWHDLERGVIVQKKTGWPKYFHVSPDGRKAAEAIRLAGEDRVLGAAVTRRHALTGMKRLREAAGLPIGGTKAIRKGAASTVEKLNRGCAARFLGHKTAGIAERHYLDPSIVNADAPAPPPLNVH